MSTFSFALAALLALTSPGVPVQDITSDEKQALIFMREEEKMAFDAYNVFADKWGGRPFSNIARAEQRHMDSVKTLLDKFQLADPIAKSEPGKFKNPDLQKLSEALIARGSKSKVEALKAGAEIEEIDIVDLDKWMKTTKNPDVAAVFKNLTLGSHNHLRAFVSNLQRSGIDYKPTILSQKEFDKIIDPPTL